IRKQAESYVDEIAGDQRIQVHHFLYYILKWLFASIFDGIDLKESQFARLKTKNQEGSLIYVSCHKSHLDYLIIGYLSFINRMAIPYMAAGKNLSFWPVGPLLRNAGAFFIRRSFKGLGLYPHVFAAYLKVLVKEKLNINFYIEGGRSRTGKLLPPRVGMLGFLLQAVREGSVDDLTFVPTFVGYDQVPEESSYLRELAGREKQKESLTSLLRSWEILRRRFGRAYVRFHEPISYRSFCTRYGTENGRGQTVGEENRKLIQDFAYHLMYGIVRAGVVTPVDLVAAGLGCANNLRVTHEFLIQAIGYLCNALDTGGIELAESLANREVAVQTTLGLFAVRGFINVEPVQSDPGLTTYVITEHRRPNLEFYKNGIVNYVWPASLLAALLLTGNLSLATDSRRLLEEFTQLKGLLSKELIWDPLVTDGTLVEDNLKLFSKKGWLMTEPDGEIKMLNITALRCFRGIILDLAALYHRVLVACEMVEDRPIGQKEFMKLMARIGPDGSGGSEQPPGPVLSIVTIDNALTRFAEMGILDYGPTSKVLGGINDADQYETVKRFLAQLLGLSA
ncbi:MAG: 1-acyl-sn-glycerol-3-phosphate acyltransferase, partial [Deltaproteobacteria bacterium]|nr:1-acyl-sn-glycerol-3-phosphate acyltransferase [Deltaproteobacteria bacterium]